MQNTEAKLVLVHPSLLDTVLPAAKQAGLSTDQLFQFSQTENPTKDGIRDWRAMLASPAQSQSYEWPELDGDEAKQTIATINYSSGTTGLPKGVCVSHYNLVANILQTTFSRQALLQYGPEGPPETRWIGFLPLYHVYGQMYTILMASRIQAPVYVMPRFVLEDYLRVIQEHKITYLNLVPPIMVMLAKRPEVEKYDLSSVVEITCGAAPLSRELQNEVAKKFGVEVKQGWGMTEVTTGAMHVPAGMKDE